MRPEFVACLLTATVATLSLAPAAHADTCQSDLAGGLKVACFDQLGTLDLDVSLLPKADVATIPRAAATQAVEGTIIVPLTVKNSDAGVSVRTSLGTLQDYTSRLDTQKVDTAKALAPTGMPLPLSPVVPKSPLDLWSKFDAHGYEWAGNASTRAGVGFDYRFDRAVSAGVAAERGDFRSAATPGTQTYDKVDAHIAYQITPSLSLNTRAEFQTGNADFAATKGLDDKGAVSFAPKLTQTFPLGEGQSMSTFATFTRELDLEQQVLDGPHRTSAIAQSAGAGVSFEKRDSYTLSVTTDIGSLGSLDLGSLDPATLRSRLQLKLPIQ